MKPIHNIILKTFVFLFLVTLFQASFYRNVFRLETGISTFEEFEASSEQWVVLMMHRTLRDGLGSTGGLLIVSQEDGARTPVYLSAFGLQGQFFSWLNQQIGGNVEQNAEIFRYFVALATSILMSLFALYVVREWGWTAALLFVVGANLSVWMVFAARNIYIMYFLKLLPFLLSMMLFPIWLDRPHFRFGWMLGIIGVSVLASGLCYYDYLSNTVLGLAVAPIYYGVTHRLPLKKVIRFSTALILVGALALATAVMANVVKCSLWLGSFPEAIGHIQHVLAARTYADIDPSRSAVGMSLWQVWNGYLPLPALVLPFGSPDDFSLPLSIYAFASSWVALTALAFLDGRLFPAFEAARPKLLGLAAASGWGLLATASWGLLMKGHMAHHFHMNGMMFTLPYLLLHYIFTGVILATIARQITAWFTHRQISPCIDVHSFKS